MITLWLLFFFFFKQKTAYEMRISDWSSDVCSSDLAIDNIGLEGGAVPQDARRDAILVDRHSQRMGQIGVLGLRHAVAIEDVRRRAPHEPVTRALDPAGGRGTSAGPHPFVQESGPVIRMTIGRAHV